MIESRPRSLLPHALALLYGLAIVFTTLQPFAPWIPPASDAPFWPFAPWPPRWTRFDVTVNLITYVPLGAFVALTPRRASPLARTGIAFAVGLALSFAMETLQMFLPPRDASVIDLAANACGALAGGALAATLVRAGRAREPIASARHGVFLPGKLGDFGLALLALWLVAQANPGIPLFAVTFEPDAAQRAGLVAGTTPDIAGILIEAAQSALQLLGVGLFLALLLRERRFVGGAVLVLVGTALLVKGVAAMLLLKPAVWETWLKPGISIGVAAGLLVLLLTLFLPRPAEVAACAIALLASVLLPLAVADIPSARASLSLFNWRHGQLLNYNGLTQAVLLVWPLAAAAWLFALAGRPAWGAPDGDAER